MRNPYTGKCPSIYRGVVESNIDPENLGRCKIRVPSVHGRLEYSVDILPWARPIVLSPVHKNRGSVNIPDIGDIVWVFFEGENKEFPLYLGGTYATGELDIDSDRVDFYVEDNTSISYLRGENKYIISIDDTKLEVSSSGIEVNGDLKIEGDIRVSGNTHLHNLTVTGDFIRD